MLARSAPVGVGIIAIGARRLAPDARRRLLGHRGVPDDPADPRNRPPDRLSDLRHPRLARLDRPGPVRRARVPDEPPVGDPRRGRGSGSPSISSGCSPARRSSVSPPGSASRPPRSCGSSAPMPTRMRCTWRCSPAVLWLLVRWEHRRDRRTRRAPTAGSSARRSLTGLSVGNHSLTLLLGLPIGLLRPRRRAARSSARGGSSRRASRPFVVPDRARLSRAADPGRPDQRSSRPPLVYGRPDTLDGFAYVVTGDQFRGGLNDPFGDLPGKLGDLVSLAVRSSARSPRRGAAGLRRHRDPPPRLCAPDRHARSSITCFFNAAYVNAEIERYYLGPALIAWIVAGDPRGGVVDCAPRRRCSRTGRQRRPPDEPSRPRRRRRRGARRPVRRERAAVDLLRPRRRPASRASCCSLPTIAAFPARAAFVDRTATGARSSGSTPVLAEVAPGSIVVSWWSYSTPLWYAQVIEGRRTDIFVADDRTRIDLSLGEVTDVIDGNLAHRTTGLRDPGRHAASSSSCSPLQAHAACLAVRAERVPGDAAEQPWTPVRDGAGRAPVLLLPGPQRRGQSPRPRRGGPRDAPGTRRDVRDRHRRRRLPRRDGRDRRRAGGAASGRRPRRPPPDEPRLRRRAPLRVPGGPPRSRRVHRRRPPVPRRGPRPADRAPRGRRSTGRRRRLPDQARRSRSSGRSTRGPTGSRTSSGSACGSATSTAPASCSGGQPSRASPSSRAARSSRRSS